MSVEKSIKKRICYILFGWIFALLALLTPMVASTPVFAEPETDTETSTTSEQTSEVIQVSEFNGDACKDNLESIGWLVCPTMNVVTDAVDSLYTVVKDLLVIKPLEAKDSSPIYTVWKYCLGVANTIFVIFLLVVVFSQITGVGITNYGIKKVLPKLIIAAILINISFLLCTLAVDISNIIGQSLRNIFDDIPIVINGVSSIEISKRDIAVAVLGGASIAYIAFTATAASLWMLIPTLLAGLAAVVSGLITIALRQTVVILLVMIAPLAIVCSMLPNTNDLYKKWFNLFKKMLVFYPIFSLLFGASNLAGWAIIASGLAMAEPNAFMVILGLGVQIMPLFFSWSLMRMSGTFLNNFYSRIRSFVDKPIAANRAWAETRKQNTRANQIANGSSPSAYLQRYLAKRRDLIATDTKNAQTVVDGMAKTYTQRKIAGIDIAENTEGKKAAKRYTKTAKLAKNYGLLSQNAEAHTEHVLDTYGTYYSKKNVDKTLSRQSEEAYIDYGRSVLVRDIDNENDINFLTERYLRANKRDANNVPLDKVAFDRYVKSVGSEEKVISKIIAQAAKVESKQKAELAVFMAKYGHNGYNKPGFRNFTVGYYVDDDGWATDENGKRLTYKDENGKEHNMELVRGELLFRDPSKLHFYDKRDKYGLYFDMKDQDGNVIARVHRGTGADGLNYDNASYMKELLSNWDIPIGDPINDIYAILSGIHPGDIKVEGAEDIGLAKYSTTIGRALSTYKDNAAWSGAMFTSEVGNRQIKNPAQYALAVLDSIVKTLKPGNFNRQNPASVKYLATVLDPKNWDRIFTEEWLEDAININNKLVGGEDWVVDENGKPILDENGNIQFTKLAPGVEPTHEQRMNRVKRKFLFPAMQKVLPAFDRLRTSNTADNQKPGTADEQYDFLDMVEKEWMGNDNVPIDVTLVTQDLPNKAREFRDMKHDKDGNPIYKTSDRDTTNRGGRPNLAVALSAAFDESYDPDMYKYKVFQILNSDSRCSRALTQFDEFCSLNPNATMSQIRDAVEDEVIPLISD